MHIKPLGERLVVKPLEREEKTKSGIVLPDTAKEKPQMGKVLAVGSGKLLDNEQRVRWKLKPATRSSSRSTPGRKSNWTAKKCWFSKRAMFWQLSPSNPC